MTRSRRAQQCHAEVLVLVLNRSPALFPQPGRCGAGAAEDEDEGGVLFLDRVGCDERNFGEDPVAVVGVAVGGGVGPGALAAVGGGKGGGRTLGDGGGADHGGALGVGGEGVEVVGLELEVGAGYGEDGEAGEVVDDGALHGADTGDGEGRGLCGSLVFFLQGARG
jgi:hypothetical protein